MTKDLTAAIEKELEALAREWRPPYVRFLRRVPGYKRFGYSAAALLVSVFVFLYVSVLAAIDIRLRNPWSALLLPLMVGFNLRLATEGYLVALRTARSVLQMASDFDGVEKIATAFRSIFVSRYQTWLCLGLGIIDLLSLITLRISGSLPAPFQSLDTIPFTLGLLPVLVFSILGGSGVWLVLSLMQLLRKVGNIDRPNLNLLAPHATVGIRALSLLSKRFALCFSLGLALFLWPILFLEWQPGEMVAALIYSWPLFSLVLILMLLLSWRQAKVKLIRDAKSRSLWRIQTEIQSVLDGATLSPEQTTHLQELLTLYKEVDQSRDPLVRLGSITSWVSALGIQLPFLIEWSGRSEADIRQWYQIILEALRLQ